MKTLNDFKNIEHLLNWLYHNTKGTSYQEDEKFYFPEEIFSNKKCNCFDIAFAVHLFCENRDIFNKITCTSFDYRIPGKKIQNNGHIVCVFQDLQRYGKWYIANIDGINENFDMIFGGYESYTETIEKFSYVYLPMLVKWIKDERKCNFDVLNYHYSVYKESDINKVERLYYAKTNVNNKQEMLTQFEKNAGIIKLKMK